MDLKSLKKSFFSGLESAKKTAKNLGNKTLSFANEQIAQTGLFMTKKETYELLIQKEKRVIIIAYDETDQVGRDLVLLLSVWMTKSMIDGSTLRYVSIDPDDMPDFAQDEKFQWPVEMRVFFEGEETNRFTTLDEMKQWWGGERIYKVKFVPQKKVEKTEKKTTKKSTPTRTPLKKTTTQKTTRKTRTKKTDNVAPADPLATTTKK